MLNPIAEPDRAMTVSNDGTKIAIRITATIVNIRIDIFMIPRAYEGRPTKGLDVDIWFGRSPRKPSMVPLMGATLEAG